MKQFARELQKLLKSVQDLIDYFHGRSVTALPEREYVVGFVASWTRHVETSIPLTLHAHRRNETVLAYPILRLMIEHAIASAMVAEDPNTWNAYLRSSTKGAKNVREQSQKLGLANSKFLDNFIANGLEDEPQLLRKYRTQKARFESQGESGERLYYWWLLATQGSHAGFATASYYLNLETEDGWPTLKRKAQVGLPIIELLSTCIDCLLWCQDAFSSMLIDDPLRSRIEELQDRHLTILQSIPNTGA